MAKKQKTEKVIVKGFGIISFVIAIALYALAIYGNNLFIAEDNNIFDISIKLISDDPSFIESVFGGENVDMKSVMGMMFIFIESIIVVIVSIKLFFMFFGLLGFIGKKDAKVVAKKLSKFTKSALGAVAIEIFGLLIYSADDGVLSEDFNTLILLAGIAFGVIYVLVRLYRWFISSKRPILDCVFDVLKDCVYIGALLILISFVDVAFLSKFTVIQTYFEVEAVEGVLNNKMINDITAVFVVIMQFVIMTSLMRKTLRLLPFNNYKKSAYGKLNFGYVSYFIISLLLAALSLTIGDLIAGTFDTANILALVLDVLVMVLPQLLAMVAVLVVGLVESEKPEFAYPLSKVKELQAKEEQVQAEAQQVAE